MKKIILTTLAALAAIAFARQAEVKVVKVSGQVRVLQDGGSVVAKPGMVLSEGSTIKTFSGAQITLSIGNATKTIAENKMITVDSLTGGVDSSSGILGKLTTRSFMSATPSAVAGVRGAEQGKKGGFGVIWAGQGQSHSVSGSSAVSEVDQARRFCEAQDFEGAVTKLNAYVGSTKDDQGKARAFLVLAHAQHELGRYADASASASAGLVLGSRDPSVVRQLKLALVSSTWLSGKPDAAVAAVDAQFKDAGAGEEYWNAQLIKLLALKSLKDLAGARKLKADLSTTCPNEEIVAAVAQIQI